MLRSLFIIYLKDLKSEIRSLEGLASGFVFVMLSVFVVSAASAEGGLTQQTATGIYWVILIFTANLVAGRIQHVEMQDQAYKATLMACKDKSSFIFGKALTLFTIILFVASFSHPLFAIINAQEISFTFWSSLAYILGIWSLSVTSIFFATLAHISRAGDMLIPILQLPIISPLLIASVTFLNGLTADLFNDTALMIIIAYSVIVTALIYILYPLVSESV